MTSISNRRQSRQVPSGERPCYQRGNARNTVLRGMALAFALAFVLAASGCAFVDKPLRSSVYDFGPGSMTGTPPGGTESLGVVALSEVETGSALDNTSVMYRLVYANNQQLLPYAQARWSTPPAQLVRERLRDVLGQRRTVLSPGDGNVSGARPTVMLRVELEEFSQLFDAPAHSYGLVRLRATVLQGSGSGDRLMGQRNFVVQRPAPTPDAAGGVHALSAATGAAADEIEQWLSQLR